MASFPAKPRKHLPPYQNQLAPFLNGLRVADRHALVLLPDEESVVAHLLVCSIVSTTVGGETITLTLDGAVNGVPIVSVSYTHGDPYPLTAAGERCIVFVDDRRGEHVAQMLDIWRRNSPEASVHDHRPI